MALEKIEALRGGARGGAGAGEDFVFPFYYLGFS
jgi:hypothetical protein